MVVLLLKILIIMQKMQAIKRSEILILNHSEVTTVKIL